jgi:hypothetical protein
VPEGHDRAVYVHEEAPTVLYRFEAQDVQQDASPSHDALHVPAGQRVHDSVPPGLVEPAGHAVQNKERATLTLPEGQDSQLEPDENVPDGHSLVHLEAPSLLHSPAGQGAQNEEPPPTRKVFAGQREQAE